MPEAAWGPEPRPLSIPKIISAREDQSGSAQGSQPILLRSPVLGWGTGPSHLSLDHLVGAASGVSGNSALRRKNDAEQHPFVRACLPGSADMSATVRRDHVVDFVVGNRRPFAVHLDFVMVADHAALRWATVHEVTAGAFAVVSVELQIKVLMPPIMADPVISFLRRRADTKERRDDADYRYASSNIRDHNGLPK